MSDFETPPTPQQPALSGRVARSAAWVLGAGLLARLLGTVNTIIVARLLAPDDIGIVAVATITMQLLQGFSDIGVSQAVVKFQNADRQKLDTLFTLSVIRGVILGALLLLAAPIAREFLADPRIFWAFIGISAFPVITSFMNPRFYEFERELSFSREFLTTVINKLAGVVVSITVAFYFRTYWAIILGLITGGVVQLLLSYWFRPYAPRFTFGAFNELFGFTGWLTGVSFMAALNNKLDVPILARIAGEANAGVYFMGMQLSEMVIGQLAMPLTRAIYPGLSSLQAQQEKMKAAYLRGVEAIGIVAIPAAFGFSFVAEDLTHLLLGDKWNGVVPVVQLLAPVIGLQSMFYATQAYAISLGKTRQVFFRELIFFLVRFPLFVWATLTYGFKGAVIAAAAAGIFHVTLNLALYQRISGGSFLEPLIAARRSIGAAMAMALFFLLLRPTFAGLDSLPLILRLGVDAMMGGAIYLFTLVSLWLVARKPDGVERMALNVGVASLAKIFR